MKYAVLAIIGAVNTRKLVTAPKEKNFFATGMAGDEDLGSDIIMKGDKFHYNQGESLVQTQAMSQTKVKTGTKARAHARWVELPDCPYTYQLGEHQIALRADLSNASIATCKSFHQAPQGYDPANYYYGPYGNYDYSASTYTGS